MTLKPLANIPTSVILGMNDVKHRVDDSTIPYQLQVEPYTALPSQQLDEEYLDSDKARNSVINSCVHENGITRQMLFFICNF